MNVLHDLTIELVRHHESYSLQVMTEQIVIRDGALTHNDGIIGFHHAFLGVNAILCLALNTKSQQDAVDATRVMRPRQIGQIIDEQQIITDITGIIEHLLGMCNGNFLKLN